VKLREIVSGHKELARKMAQLEQKLSVHDDQIIGMVKAIKQLMSPKPPPKTRQIGFNKD
jgi:hypothetical protein